MAAVKKSSPKASKLDLFTIGDCNVDIFTFPERADVHCQLHGDEKCELCLEAAGKITSKGFALAFGGNAANVAVGASRLGLKTAIYTHVGKDVFGSETIENLAKEKVETGFVVTDKDTSTNVNVVVSFGGERTILAQHQSRHYNVPAVSASWIYFSSLAPRHASVHHQIPSLVKRTGAKLAFNPGSYQLKEGRKELAPVLERTTILVVNRSEAGRLLGTTHELEDERQILARLRHLGPRVAVVTDGPAGSYGFDGGDFIFQPATAKRAVERTGAGDAFSCGLVAALVLGKTLKEALKWGTVDAEAVTQEIGAQKGLLSRAALEKRLVHLK
jgi:ribokinase